MPHRITAFDLFTYARASMPAEGEQVSLAFALVSLTAWWKVQAIPEPLLGWEKINFLTGKCN